MENKIKKIKLKSFLNLFILVCILIFVIFIYFNNIKFNNTNVDYKVIITFVMNGTIITFGCINDKRKYSLNKVYWYFNLFFFFIAPLCQYLSAFSAWNYVIKNEDYLNANLMFFLWNLIYILSYKTNFKSKNLKEIKVKKETKFNVRINRKTVYWLIFLDVFIFGLALKFIGFDNLFIRQGNTVDVGTGFLNTIITNTIRAIPVLSFVYIFSAFKNKKTTIFPLLISLLFVLILNYPVSITRYWIGAVYIGIFIILFEKFLGERTFDYTLIVALALIFPIFQLFKWFTLSDIMSGQATKNLINVYNNVDFDAYSMFARCLIYVQQNTVLYGKQLMSSLLFFVPRMIWVNKAVHTGELIATVQGQNFTNLACPLIGEAYVNFGIVGIVLYPFVFAKIFKCLDKKYWEKDVNSVTLINYIYPFSMGLLIFLLRGSFHPAVVYIFTFYLPIIVLYVYKFLSSKIKKKEREQNE